MRYYEAAYLNEDGSIQSFGNGNPDLWASRALCEFLNMPNPRKPHPNRAYFVAYQDRPDWQAL